MAVNDFSDDASAFSMDIPAVPMDQNGKTQPVLMGAILEDGAIVRYRPIRCKDNGDGTCTPYVDITG